MFNREHGEKVYSYIRYPLSKGSFYALFLGIISFIITACVIIYAVKKKGEINLLCASLSLTAILMGLIGFSFSISAIREREHNHVLGIIGLILSALSLILWLVIIAV